VPQIIGSLPRFICGPPQTMVGMILIVGGLHRQVGDLRWT